jgi:putative ABC transport system ATP-binding protein
MNKPVIEVRDLTKTFHTSGEDVHAVDGVNLSISAGEFSTLVAPSGAGKTTLLNLIGGLDRPNSGEVRVMGTDMAALSDRDLVDFRLRNIGFVFQSYNLIPVLSALENVEFIMLLQGVGKQERRKRAREVLLAVGLEREMDRRPGAMSGGQQQRVAVARALASKPAFILADEPTANLDSHSAENLLEIMERLNREEGITFLFSTHDPRVVARARRVISMLDGQIASDEVRTTGMAQV